MRLGLGYGLDRSSGGTWNPSRIANLEVFLRFNSGNCFTSDYPSESGVAAVGDPVRWVKPLYGSAHWAEQDTLGNRPILRSNGMEFDGADDYLSMTPLNLTDFTIYGVASRGTGENTIFLGDSALQGLVGWQGGTDAYVFDDSANGLTGANDATGSVLFRAANDNPDEELEITGSIGITGTATTTFTFDTVGASIGNSIFTSSGSRLRLLIVVARYIELGSVEDLRIRTWILNNESVELYGNSYVGPDGEHYYQPDGIHYYLHP